jgi:alkyl hydroperoxide reductase subunit F
VAVVGGGNSGVEAAIDLAGIASEVVLFEYADRLKADQILIDKLNSLSNTSVILSARTKAVLGNQSRVEALLYEDRTTGEEKRIELDGIFVQIGLLPNSGFLNGTVDLSPQGEILIDAKGRTSEPGIYAAGDVTNIPFKQIIIAMGEGAKAALTAFEDRTKLPPKIVPELIIPIASST